MPQGTPEHVPDDGLTTRQRRNRPLLIVHTGPGKGKSTAAFGLALRAWNQGWPVGVFQFVKSGKWKVGEHKAARELGGIDWEKMGDGWTWISKDLEESADRAREGWAEVSRRIADERYEFLLLDEPIAGVHPVIRRQIAETLSDLRARGRTLLVIEHHMPFVMGLCDKIVVMDHGMKIAEGTPEAIRADPRVVAALLGHAERGDHDAPA